MESYAGRVAAGLEPENVDKEFLRLWFAEHCDPYNDPELPAAPEELVVELSRRYVYLYEKITGQPFAFPDPTQPVAERIRENLAKML
jgi:phosphoribosylaminoimidazole-succinocarboxamide synthase